MDKKGVELAFNTIIMAVIGLIVLIVIVFMIFKGSTDHREGTACFSEGGRCVDSGTCNNPVTQPEGTTDALCSSTQVCCSLAP